KAIVDFIEKEASKHNPDILREKIHKNGYNVLDGFIYRSEKVKITFSLIPKSKKIRGKNGDIIGMWPIETEWIAHNYLKQAFKKKATRYGNLDKPYLICINDMNKYGSDERTVIQAFFGSELAHFDEDSINKKNVHYARKPDGIFFNKYDKNYSR